MSVSYFGEDLNFYYCLYVFSAVPVSVYSQSIVVDVFPSFAMALNPREQTRFECYYNGRPSCLKQTYWTHNGVVLPYNQRRQLFGCNDTLVLSHFQYADSGRYNPHVTDIGNSSVGWGEIRGKIEYIDTHSKHDVSNWVDFCLVPGLLDESIASTVFVSLTGNATVTIRCPVFIGSCPKPQVVWRQQGETVSIGESMSLRLANESQLGRIDCVAYNGHGAAKVKQFNLVLGEDKLHAGTASPVPHSETSDPRTSGFDTSYAQVASYTSATGVAAIISSMFYLK